MAQEEDEVVEKTTTQEETETTETETTETDHSKDQIDYQAEAEAEEKRGQPDPLKAQESFREREAKREAGEEDDDSKPLTRRDLEGILSADRQARLKDDSVKEAIAIAGKLSSNEAERRAILAKWKNRTFPADMSLQDQMEEMHAAVNRKRILATNSELSRALKSKDTVSHDPAGTHRDPPQAGEPQLSAADKIGYKGYQWDGTRRAFKKPIAGGKKHLFKDPTSKRTWVE